MKGGASREAPAPARSPVAFPEFLSGDECLFCHRGTAADRWEENAHNGTVHAVGGGAAAKGAPPGAEYGLGARETRYWLKRGGRYGTLSLFRSGRGWDPDVFNRSCAGCHASGVDPESGSFLAVSLDCFACHGDVRLEHTRNPELVLFSPRRAADPRVTVSACGACHLRGGRSRVTGRPWPRFFIAGNLLPEDFAFDFSRESIARLPRADRHVAENARAVLLEGRESPTCLSCHGIHSGSSRKHRRVPKSAFCLTCHEAGGRWSEVAPLEREHPICRVDGEL